jgi:hypothetical protein
MAVGQVKTTEDVGKAVRVAQDKLMALARVAQVTGDPSAPVLEALAATVTAIHGMTAGMAQQLDMTEAVGEVRALVGAAERVADRPVMNHQQVKTIVLPGLIGAIKPVGALINSVLLVVAFLAGMAVFWWMTPTLTCSPERGGISCGYWKVPPVH